jgi:hypothetical protein
MPHPRFSNEEIVQRGEEIYAQKLREKVETEDNIGKVIVIDIETGEYEIDDDALKASRRALDKHSGAAIYTIRIRYDTVYGFGGGPTRVKRRSQAPSPAIVLTGDGRRSRHH